MLWAMNLHSVSFFMATSDLDRNESPNLRLTALNVDSTLPKGAWDRIDALLCAVKDDHVGVLRLQRVRIKQFKNELSFIVPLASRDKVISVASTIAVEKLWVSVVVGNVEVTRIEGKRLKGLIAELGKHVQNKT